MEVTTLNRGNLAPPEVEALQASREVAEVWSVAALRPCVARIFQQGASRGEGRQPLAHLLGLEMDSLGLPVDRVEGLLRDWNTRVSPPLQGSEIQKVVRRLERPGRWPYGCKHPALTVYCIGDGCPHRTAGGRWQESRVSANGLTCSGWLPLLSGSEVRVWLGLYRLARLKGRGPASRIPFCFWELEQSSGVSRSHLREVLLQLARLGLVTELNFSQRKGELSYYRFPGVLPEAPNNNRGK